MFKKLLVLLLYYIKADYIKKTCFQKAFKKFPKYLDFEITRFF